MATKIAITTDYIKRVDKLWGTEYWLINNELYCRKFLMLLPGRSCSKHYHKIKDETFYVEYGVVSIEIDGEITTLRQGQSVRIRPGQVHRFWNDTTQEAIIDETSTQHDDADVVRLEESKIL